MEKRERFTPAELKPEGWLLRQLRLEAEGLTGNLDQVWPDVRDSAWIGGDRDGWERVPYWLDGFIPLAYLLGDGDMIARAGRYVRAIMDRQQEDGWICPCSEAERGEYDTWAVFLITKVLTVYYRCSGDEAAVPVIYRAVRNFYDLLKAGTLKLHDWGQFRWFEGFIALNFLWERFGEPWMRDMARILKEQGADYEALTERWKKPLFSWTLETHVVNAVMMLKSEAVSAELLGEEYTDLAERLLDVLMTCNGTAVGTITGDECLGGLSPIQGTELCAVVEQMYAYEVLYAYTGDRKWADRLETVAFNALPATISDDCWSHQYVQMVNQIACIPFPGKSPFRTNGPEAHLFGLEPQFGCCTANMAQGWPKLALSAFMRTKDAIECVVPLPSVLTVPEGTIRLVTDYPFRHSLRFEIDARQAFTLAVRIPSFAKDLRVNGQSWQGDVRLGVEPGASVIEISFRADAELIKRPRGLEAVQYGALVFALPIEYTTVCREYERYGVLRQFPYCDYELHPTSPWSYGLAGRDFTAEERPVGAVPFSAKEPPVVLRARLAPIDWGMQEGYEQVAARVPESTAPTGPAQVRELIPYGAAKLRITEMPPVNGA